MRCKSFLCGQVLGLLLCVVVLTACSRDTKKETFNVPGTGKVTVEENKKAGESTVTLKSDKGETVISTNQAKESDFDVPFYPGAAQEESGALSVAGQSKEGSGKWSMVTLRTKDSFEDVVKFYKEKLSNAQAFETSTDEGKTAVLTKGGGPKQPVTTVQILRDKTNKETQIVISRAAEK